MSDMDLSRANKLLEGAELLLSRCRITAVEEGHVQIVDAVLAEDGSLVEAEKAPARK